MYLGESGYFNGAKLRHGLGVMIYQSGRIYEGFWFKDKRHGKGYEKYKNGDIFLGEFKDGKPEGKGRRLWIEKGETYEGEWSDGLMHGIGKWALPHEATFGVYGAVDMAQGKEQKIDKQLIAESYTGKFNENYFDGYGIYTVKYRSRRLEKEAKDR